MVRNALSITGATFPREWMSTVPPLHPNPQNHRNPIPTGPPPAQWPTPAPTPAPAPGPGKEPTPPREDVRHPKIKALMDPYLQKYNNRIDLITILNASGKRMADLPTLLPKYCTPTGTSFLCCNHMLGKCYRNKRCTYARGHIVKGNMTDDFADAVMDVISKGVLYYTSLSPTGSPQNKQKGEGAQDS
jgi:hypothetical protein